MTSLPAPCADPVTGALVFDFNGTLSDDEPILCEIYMRLFAALGRPLSREEYFERLAGHTDPEIVRAWLGDDFPALDEVVAKRVELYRAAVTDGSTVAPPVREAVRYAAERVPVAICSGATRVEIETVVDAAGLGPLLVGVVAAEDVVEGKPHPEGYLRALELFDAGIRADDVVAFEDTEVGVAAAKAAGVRCIAKRGTLDPRRLARADELVDAITVDLMQRLLG